MGNNLQQSGNYNSQGNKNSKGGNNKGKQQRTNMKGSNGKS